MKILLINPTMNFNIGGNLPRFVDEARGNIPPLGLLYVASVLEDKHEVEILDMMAGDSMQFKEKEAPDLVGVTVTTFTLLDAIAVANTVKWWWPHTPVIFGGIHPTIYPTETQQLTNVDHVFVGEAERGLPLMIESLCQQNYGEIADVSQLKPPARHLIDQTKYTSVLGTNKNIATMFTSRGCPFKCIFCHRKTMGKQFRARTARQVVDEIKDIIATGIGEILIYDDTFTIDRNRVMKVCELIRREGVKVAFDIRARVDTVDQAMINSLALAGCKRIHYGVEASSDRILETLQKGITIEQVETAFKYTKAAGIETLAYFIIGSPGETVADIQHTIRYARELKPDYCHFSIMTPYPATPLYDQGLKDGLYEDYWQEFAQNPTIEFTAPHWPKQDEETLQRLIMKAYKSFYWQPTRIIKEVIKTRSPRQFAKKAMGAVKTLVGG